MALSQFLVLLVLAPQAWGDFLSGIKLGDPSKLDMNKLPKVQLPPVISSGAQAVEKVARGNPGQLADGLMNTLNSSSFHKDFKVKAPHGLLDARQEASGALKKAAGTVSKAKPQDVQNALADAAGPEAVGLAKSAAGAVKKVAEVAPTARPAAIAKVLRRGTSLVAQAVNQTSLHAAEFVQTFGPRAAAFLNSTGHQMASKLAGPDRVLPFDLLPPDVSDRSLAALCGAVLLLLLSVGGTFLCFLGRKAASYKGHSRLTEALMPLAESSARTPGLQMATQEDALLRQG